MRVTATVRDGVGRRALLVAAGAAMLVGGQAATSAVVHAAGTSVISGTVFQDMNRNGVEDAGEQSFSNVRMVLYDATGANVAATYTDAGGAYSFGGLGDGSYTVAFDPQAWWNYRSSWIMTSYPSTPAPGYLQFRVPVSLSGAATARFPLRPIVRSTTYGSPITTLTAPGGTVISSYDDVVTAQQLYDVLQTGRLFGAEQPFTEINFDYGTANETATSVSGGQGSYSGYHAQVWLQYISWLDQFDETLFHEYGHAWSEYYMYIVQQDDTLASYLQYRGLTGNPNLSTSHMWQPMEMIAEDYRQLFGSPNAASYPQENNQITPAAQVPGLATWLQNTFTQPPGQQTVSQTGPAIPAPAVSSMSPSVGPAAGGTTVTITGSNFTGSNWNVSGVAFGGAPAQSFTVSSPTQIVAVAPAGSALVDVTVTTTSTGGIVQTSVTGGGDQYAYAPVPVITKISPASGTMKGGTSVTITGTGFAGPGFSAITVRFGSLSATFTVVSSTTIVATSPSTRTAQAVTVTVTTAGGTSSGCSACSFTYTRK